MKKKTAREFEVVPLSEVLQKAQLLQQCDPDQEDLKKRFTRPVAASRAASDLKKEAK